MKRLLAVLLSGLLLACTLAGCGQQEKQDDAKDVNKVFYNPVDVAQDMGDPWVVQHEGYYYYTRSDGATVSVTKTKDLTAILPNTAYATPIYVGANDGLTQLWAPELHFYKGSWYCIFAADVNNDNTLHRTYLLKSKTDDILGEWDFLGKLDLPADQWSIDATLFENNDGKLYCIWSGWKNQEEGTSKWKQNLYIAELAQGDPTKVLSEKRVMLSEAQLLWENGDLPQNEGPAILKSPKGTAYLVYSANYSGKNNYALGYLQLEGENPLDPNCWKKNPEPFMESDNEALVYSPGHCSFTKSPDGTEDWILYHAAKAYSSGWDRSARLQKVEWIDDRPYAKVLSLNTPVALPSGEKGNRIAYELEAGELTGGAKAMDYEGASGKKAVSMADGGSAAVTVEVPQDGRYCLYVRHNNPGELNSSFSANVNGEQEYSIFAGRTEDSETFSMTAFTAELRKGKNTITFETPADIELDLLVLDKTPMGE